MPLQREGAGAKRTSPLWVFSSEEALPASLKPALVPSGPPTGNPLPEGVGQAYPHCVCYGAGVCRSSSLAITVSART